MRLNSNRDSSRSIDANTYWRRRFFVLGGGLAVLACVAWLFSGSGEPSPGRSASAASSAATVRARDTLPAAAYASASPGYTRALIRTATPTASPSAGTAALQAKPSQARSPAPATPTGSPTCASRGVVLSLFTSRPSYGQSALPQFDVYAVSTASSPCVMTYGIGAVRIVVTKNGQVVWDSAACGSPAAKPVQLQLGVPYALTIRWNRQATAPSGCAGSLSPGAWGTFEAVAKTAGQTSQVRTFRLLG